MAAPTALETPASAASLYLARGTVESKEFADRPLFTGDVLELPGGRLVSAVHHPCALRRGAELVPRLLVAEVEWGTAKPPSDWGTSHFKRMFLPEVEAGVHAAVDFSAPDVMSAESLSAARRKAILSLEGVNLLLQRYVFHVSRVAVPTITFNEMIAGPFEEADLTYEAIGDLVAGGFDSSDAVSLVDAWLTGDRSSSPRRDLDDPQKRSTVRRALRVTVREEIARLARGGSSAGGTGPG